MEEAEDTFSHVNDKNEIETINLATAEVVSIVPLDPHLALENRQSTYIVYTVAKGEAVCDLVRRGLSYVKAAEQLQMNVNAISYWRHKHPDFAEKLKMARLDVGDYYFYKVHDIAHQEHDKHAVPGKKLQGDYFKWMAEKSNPNDYGNQTKIVGDPAQPLQIIVDTGIRREEDKVIEDTPEEGETIDITPKEN